MKDNERFFDIRVYQRYIKEGIITKKDYDSYVKSLPDTKDKSELLVIEEKEKNGEKNR